MAAKVSATAAAHPHMGAKKAKSLIGALTACIMRPASADELSPHKAFTQFSPPAKFESGDIGFPEMLQYLIDYAYIMSILEESLTKALDKEPRLTACTDFSELRLSHLFKQDFNNLVEKALPKLSLSDYKPSAAAEAYVLDIRQTADTNPILLLADHFNLTSAPFYGGKRLAERINTRITAERTADNWIEEEGTTACTSIIKHTTPKRELANIYKTRYCPAINALELSEETILLLQKRMVRFYTEFLMDIHVPLTL